MEKQRPIIPGQDYDPCKVYTVRELSRIWYVSPAVVYKAIAEGKLIAFRCGNKQWRIKDLAKVIYERRQEAGATEPEESDELVTWKAKLANPGYTEKQLRRAEVVRQKVRLCI